MSEAAAARATTSSLKPHKSSNDPPPRATISTSGRGSATWRHFVKARDGTSRWGAFVPAQQQATPEHGAETIAQTMQNITNNRTRGGCDNADHLGQIEQWIFRCIEQPFCCQCCFAFFQHRHKGTYARRFDVIYHKLIFRLSPNVVIRPEATASIPSSGGTLRRLATLSRSPRIRPICRPLDPSKHNTNAEKTRAQPRP